MDKVFIYHEGKPTEVVTGALSTRLQYNMVISSILLTLVDKCPDLRFQQILVNADIWQSTDPFYEESKQTLEKLLESNFVKEYFIKSKEGNVVDINEFKNTNR